MTSALSTVGTSSITVGVPEIQATAGLLSSVAAVVTALRSQRTVSAAQLEQIRIQAVRARIECANTSLAMLMDSNLERLVAFVEKMRRYEEMGLLVGEAHAMAKAQLRQFADALEQSVNLYKVEVYR